MKPWGMLIALLHCVYKDKLNKLKNAVYFMLTSGATAVSQPPGFLSLLSGKFSAKLVASSPRLQGEKARVEGFAFVVFSSRRERGKWLQTL